MPTNREDALKKYRRNAVHYDHGGDRLARARAAAIALLHAQPGATVLDVGCGTGLSFPLIEERVGRAGHIIGIEQSHDMLARAKSRVEEHGWQNVTLIESPVEDAELLAQADAAVFCFVHDILQTPRALENVFRHLKPGARVAAAGTKWAPWWLAPLNVYVWWYITRSAMTTRENLDRPWLDLERFVPDLRVEDWPLPHQYVVSGSLRASS